MAQTQGEAGAKPEGERKRANPVLFTKQVVAELRKVRWPTRRELITYTIVVLVFVLVMIGLVVGLDFVFGEAVLRLYGGGTTS
ncbi:preprotein translocase subunit SecE [Spiractinospora alimapuensis]|uniref:preprotein translocase subunit SecE n=1 Tax=Spiractinospora alimapuensis TaxID=2820884 RepID=UPI001EEAC105|nr:preprotein translocase subunit SecE [Spiractinospora alimapuensis]QVQ51024.1 preprotein translocase subunit SecE [Spiractinospora alimapuensis]